MSCPKCEGHGRSKRWYWIAALVAVILVALVAYSA